MFWLCSSSMFLPGADTLLRFRFHGFRKHFKFFICAITYLTWVLILLFVLKKFDLKY
jgi:hypothetical protein